MRKLLLTSLLSPGDAVVMTAALKSLHDTYPGEYQTDVCTSTSEVWQQNPYITPDDGTFEKFVLNYDLIHQSNQINLSFMDAYVRGISQLIERPLHLTVNRPYIYLTDDEKFNWIDQVQQHATHGRKIQYWLINTGTKRDYTTKQWPVEHYQKVVDQTVGLIQWIQVGAVEHNHHPLGNGVLHFEGQTNHRELMRLVFHSRGALGPSTYLQHLCAAFEKPYICLLGGREPVSWVQYPKQITLHTIGQLKCCLSGACWKSRVVPLKDGDDKDNSLCEQPLVGYIKPVGKCMAIIKPDEVTAIISRIYNQAI